MLFPKIEDWNNYFLAPMRLQQFAALMKHPASVQQGMNVKSCTLCLIDLCVVLYVLHTNYSIRSDFTCTFTWGKNQCIIINHSFIINLWSHQLEYWSWQGFVTYSKSLACTVSNGNLGGLWINKHESTYVKPAKPVRLIDQCIVMTVYHQKSNGGDANRNKMQKPKHRSNIDQGRPWW